MVLFSGGLIVGKIFASEICGVGVGGGGIFGRANFWRVLLSEFYGNYCFCRFVLAWKSVKLCVQDWRSW